MYSVMTLYLGQLNGSVVVMVSCRRLPELSKVQPCYSVDGWPPVWCLAGTCLASVQLLPDITTMETNFFDIVWELNTGQRCWRDTSAKLVVVFPSFMGPGQERTVNIVAPVICWDVYRPLFVHQPDKHSATQFSLHKKVFAQSGNVRVEAVVIHFMIPKIKQLQMW